MTTFEEIKRLLGDVLQLGDRIHGFERSTALLGSIPEFDSMTVVSVLTGLEERFGIALDDDEINAEVFETVGSLCDFVDSRVSA